MIKRFNIRVYGITIRDDQVLVTDEFRNGLEMTKFPGGGLEQGEGIADCLIREFKEEFGAEITVKDIFYITDFYIASAFNKNEQLISLYYLVDFPLEFQIPVVNKRFDFLKKEEGSQTFRWIPLASISPEDFTFPVDKHVAALLHQKFIQGGNENKT